MADEDEGHARITAQSLQKFDHIRPDNGVERRGHLVAQHDLGVRGEGACQIDPLLLAAGQFMRIAFGEWWRQLDHIQKLEKPSVFRVASQPAIEFQRPADDVLDPLARVQCRVRHLINELNLAKLFPRPVAKIGRDALAIQLQSAVARRQEPGKDTGKRGFSTPGLADDADRLAALDRDVHVAQDHGFRLALGIPAITGIDRLRLERRRVAHMGVVAGFPETGLRQRLDRPHQAFGVGMLGLADDGLDRAGFLDLAVVENNDMVGDLGDHRKVVCDIDRGRTFFLDHLLEGFQHLDLGGHVERGRRLVQDKQVRLAAQGHGRHQTLQLAA